MKRLMTHVVAGYPDTATTKGLLSDMISRQIAAIEIQIPFSDPIADGPVLMAANDAAVSRGISVEETLQIIEQTDAGDTAIYIMSYLQPILHFGPEAFFKRALKAGCKGFIIPDLPFDTPETNEFIKQQPALKHALVPVLSPGMTDDRLVAVFKTLEPHVVYLTARHGITGEHTTDITNGIKETVKTIRNHTDANIAVGFGIQTSADVQGILEIADLAVVGSALTSALEHSEERAVALLDTLCAVA